jgi:hypothetical protein
MEWSTIKQFTLHQALRKQKTHSDSGPGWFASFAHNPKTSVGNVAKTAACPAGVLTQIVAPRQTGVRQMVSALQVRDQF